MRSSIYYYSPIPFSGSADRVGMQRRLAILAARDLPWDDHWRRLLEQVALRTLRRTERLASTMGVYRAVQGRTGRTTMLRAHDLDSPMIGPASCARGLYLDLLSDSTVLPVVLFTHH